MSARSRRGAPRPRPRRSSPRPRPPPPTAAGGRSPLRIDRELGAVRETSLEAGQNRLLILSEPIVRVSVADPEVADLKVITPTQVLLTAQGRRQHRPHPLERRQPAPRHRPAGRPERRGAPQAAARSSSPASRSPSPRPASSWCSPARSATSGSRSGWPRSPGSTPRRSPTSSPWAATTRCSSRSASPRCRAAASGRSGVNLFGGSKAGDKVGGLVGPKNTLGAFLNTTTLWVPGPAAPASPPPSRPSPWPSPSSSSSGPPRPFPFNATLSLLEENGLAKVLAEPTLVTLSGQEAKFLAGGELPVPFSNALGGITVEWKKFGIQLAFTPHGPRRRPSTSSVATEVSDLDPTNGVQVGGLFVPGHRLPPGPDHRAAGRRPELRHRRAALRQGPLHRRQGPAGSGACRSSASRCNSLTSGEKVGIPLYIKFSPSVIVSPILKVPTS